MKDQSMPSPFRAISSDFETPIQAQRMGVSKSPGASPEVGRVAWSGTSGLAHPRRTERAPPQAGRAACARPPV